MRSRRRRLQRQRRKDRKDPRRLIRGRRYAWKSLELSVNGEPFTTIESISFLDDEGARRAREIIRAADEQIARAILGQETRP